MSLTGNIDERNASVADEQAMSEVMVLLDDWRVPEPSPWFDGRMMARFREEQQQAPQGWFARLRDRLEFGNSFGYRPMLAGALALAVLAGGGGYLSLVPLHHSAPASATLNDLQVIDNNDQAIQQMDQLLDSQDDNSSSGSAL